MKEAYIKSSDRSVEAAVGRECLSRHFLVAERDFAAGTSEDAEADGEGRTR